MKKLGITIGLLLFSSFVFTQEVDHGVPETTIKDSTINNIKEVFTQGKVHGHIRNFFMTTINQGALKDYWANATGGSIGYRTARYKGFQLGVKGIFTFNTFSSDLLEVDPIVGKRSKWEVELFDINRPSEKKDLDRLEELFLNYQIGHSNITLGRQSINNPLVNIRDGRMKPFVFSGIYSEINEFKQAKINAGWITDVSRRATTHFHSLEEAIGMNSNGVNLDGSKANYAHTISIGGLGMLGVTFSPNKHWKFQVWEYYLHGLNNTIWLQADYGLRCCFAGLQFVHQDPLEKSGKTTDYYMDPSHRANVVSARFGKRFKVFKGSLNYTYGFNSGRLLFPRELGREALYTSVPRSWFEGKGNSHAALVKVEYAPKGEKMDNWKFNLAAGRTITTDRENPEMNKYLEQSYDQLNFDAKYKFENFLKGITVEMLYVYRQNLKGTDPSPGLIFNKANFHQFNLITNINF